MKASSRGRARQRDHGAVAVEFALVLQPLLTIASGIVQHGIYFYSAKTHIGRA